MYILYTKFNGLVGVTVKPLSVTYWLMTGNREVVGSNPARVAYGSQKHTLHKYAKQAQITYQYIANTVPKYILNRLTFGNNPPNPRRLKIY